MRVSALDRLFVTERIRRQAAQIEHGGGFALPVLQERGVKRDDAPLVATNMRGSFVQVRSSRDGYARFAFTECEREDESMLIVSFTVPCGKSPRTVIGQIGVIPWHRRGRDWRRLGLSREP